MSELGPDGEQSLGETLRIAKEYLKGEIFCTPEGMVNYAVMAIETAEADLQRLESENFTLAAGQCVHNLIGDEWGHFECSEVTTLKAELLKRESDIEDLVEGLETAWSCVEYWHGTDWIDKLIARHKKSSQG